MSNWEYKFTAIFDLSQYTARQEEMNEKGEEGWELVGIAPTDGQIPGLFCIYKRPIF